MVQQPNYLLRNAQVLFPSQKETTICPRRCLILASFHTLTVQIENNDNHPTNSPAKSNPRKTASMPAIIAFGIAGCSVFQSFLLAYFFCNPGRCPQRVGQKGRLLFSVMPAKALRWQYCSLVHKGPCDENIRVQWQHGICYPPVLVSFFTRLTADVLYRLSRTILHWQVQLYRRA